MGALLYRRLYPVCNTSGASAGAPRKHSRIDIHQGMDARAGLLHHRLCAGVRRHRSPNRRLRPRLRRKTAVPENPACPVGLGDFYRPRLLSRQLHIHEGHAAAYIALQLGRSSRRSGCGDPWRRSMDVASASSGFHQAAAVSVSSGLGVGPCVRELPCLHVRGWTDSRPLSQDVLFSAGFFSAMSWRLPSCRQARSTSSR